MGRSSEILHVLATAATVDTEAARLLQEIRVPRRTGQSRIVDFLPDHSAAGIEAWAAGVPVPTYAIDDQAAIKVRGGAVEVVSEGRWERFAVATSR